MNTLPLSPAPPPFDREAPPTTRRTLRPRTCQKGGGGVPCPALPLCLSGCLRRGRPPRPPGTTWNGGVRCCGRERHVRPAARVRRGATCRSPGVGTQRWASHARPAPQTDVAGARGRSGGWPAADTTAERLPGPDPRVQNGLPVDALVFESVLCTSARVACVLCAGPLARALCSPHCGSESWASIDHFVTLSIFVFFFKNQNPNPLVRIPLLGHPPL